MIIYTFKEILGQSRFNRFIDEHFMNKIITMHQVPKARDLLF